MAHGFYGVDNIHVHILYPKGMVSKLQELQLTTLGGNITALEVKGTFDECQALVKQAFSDRYLNSKMTLTSANSINLARLLPQTFYYFNAFARLKNKPLAVAVPSGNFGNITAGIIAAKMGLPVKVFCAATNINDVVPEYLETGSYKPRKSVTTIANAMDVGDPSNFARILEIYGQSHDSLKEEMKGFRYTDDEIRNTIQRVYSQHNYLCDPHGATGFMAAEDYLKDNPGDEVVFLETAHPAKFGDIVEPLIGEKIDLPEQLQSCLEKEKKSIEIPADYERLKETLLS